MEVFQSEDISSSTTMKMLLFFLDNNVKSIVRYFSVISSTEGDHRGSISTGTQIFTYFLFVNSFMSFCQAFD